MKTKFTVAILCILLIAVGLAGMGYHQAQFAAQEYANFVQEQSALKAQLEKERSRIDAARGEGMRQEAALNKLRAQGQKSGTAPMTPGPGLALVASNPRLLDLYLQSYRAGLQVRYSRYYQSAHLSAEQIGKLETILWKAEEEKMDLMATALTEGLAANDPSIVALRKQQAGQLQSDETTLLGEAGQAQLLQYNRMQGAQSIATTAAVYAIDSEPFSNAQIGQVAQILANSSPGFARGGPVDPRTINWDAALTQAAGVLSPVQLSTLKTESQLMTVAALQQKYFAGAQAK